MINGETAMNVRVETASGWKQDFGGKFGMFIRGHTKAEFEYLYAISRKEHPRPDQISYFDMIEGAYHSNQAHSEWVWRTRMDENERTRRPNDKVKERFSQFFYDEFGPICHEIREFDVKFDKTPCLHSRLYVSNSYQVLNPEYMSTPFGAKFMLANAARVNAVVHGEDTLTFGADNSVEQHLMVFGRALIQRESETVTQKDELAIQRRGKIETEISSRWIQNKDDAKELGKWINEHWSKPVDQISVTIFGNPLIEIGDVVGLQYSTVDATTDSHRYFVVGVSNTFSQGLETTLTLRRVRANFTV
jgi:hypothetical protein